jgi:hypothetical protein
MFHRRQVLLIALILTSGCSERLTPARASTIIRHSKAFLSGAPESQPVLDKVTRLEAGPIGSEPGGRNGDSCVAEFSYHWRPAGPPRAGEHGGPQREARVVLRRAGGSWAIDDERTRALLPSWPRLPKSPDAFGPAASDAGHGKSPQDSKENR